MIQRLLILINGAVQGVGFRPFIYRLANELELKGYVSNTSEGVIIEVESFKNKLDEFVLRIEKEKPKNSIIQSMEFSFLEPAGFKDFIIAESKKNKNTSTFILPDIAICDECLKELFDPHNRRYLYPFINCTYCGPRFSIIKSLPYDRKNTTMEIFEMCEDCEREYNDPRDRRFHAQPIACPKCGPKVKLVDPSTKIIAEGHDAIIYTAKKIIEGNIIAVKGLGGYQLICRADDDNVVQKLRSRKYREEKPFAVMCTDLFMAREICQVNNFEERLLKSPEAPIVLLKKNIHSSIKVSDLVAPSNPMLGVMLPYTPLHHLLMHELKIPVIATSGNIANEPMCISEEEAFERLNGICDYYLINNRPIERHVDDSIVRVVFGREMVMRRARGYAPLPITNRTGIQGNNFIALGGHLKNTISLQKDNNVFLSQHIGDLSTQESYQAFRKCINDFINLFDFKEYDVITDLHPDYLSSKFAKNSFTNVLSVQHHQAHIASCYEENKIDGEVLGVSWDGTGLGLDGNIWGGEFFIYDGLEFNHFAQFKNFALPGGDAAIKEPVRSAIGILFEIFGETIFLKDKFIADLFSEVDYNKLLYMLKRNINSPLTSSVGRLFDAVAFLTQIRKKITYEGEAAMMLEYSIQENISDSYSINFLDDSILKIDYSKMVLEIINDLKENISPKIISAKFHNSLANIILEIAKRSNQKFVVMSGGVFQNKYLLETTISLLQRNNFKPFWHQRIPTNDGGISYGQIAFASKLKLVRS